MNTDKFVIRVVVITVALGVLVALGALVAWGDDASRKEAFLFLGGALTGFLARTTSTSDDTQPVQVVNEPADAIPVEETPIRVPPPPINL